MFLMNTTTKALLPGSRRNRDYTFHDFKFGAGVGVEKFSVMLIYSFIYLFFIYVIIIIISDIYIAQFIY